MFIEPSGRPFLPKLWLLSLKLLKMSLMFSMLGRELACAAMSMSSFSVSDLSRC